MKNLPEMIVIGPVVFRVTECNDNRYGGKIMYSTGTIEVHMEKEYDEQYQAQTLIHEIQHGLFDTVGEADLRDNEGLVERLSNALLNTLISSPGLLDYLKRLQKKTRAV